MLYDLIIIGAGPAGLSAALYAARKKIKGLVLTEAIGGQMIETQEVDNYLGLPSISGLELIQRMQEHLEKYDDVVLSTGKKVIKIFPSPVQSQEARTKNKETSYFRLITANKDIYQAKTVIIAIGRAHRLLNIPGEKEFKGRGVSFCSICDAPFFTKKIVAVVGTGNSGLESALELVKFVKKLYLLARSERLTGDRYLQDKVVKNKKITILYQTEVLSILGKRRVERIKLRLNQKEEILKVDGLFIHIGYTPDTRWLKKVVKLNRWGEVVINEYNMTSQPGIFAAGDVTDIKWKQIIVACGEGAKAALGAAKYLEEHS